MKGRSRRETDHHYQKLVDAEVALIRASVPDAPPELKAEAVCKRCGGGVLRFGRDWSHLEQPADHVPEVK